MSSAAYAARLREANNVSDRARDPNVATTGKSMSDAAYDAWRTHREAAKPHDMSDAARAAFARLAAAG